MIHPKAATEKTPSVQHRWFGFGLIALGLALAANSLLGPLVSGLIEYRFSETLINQCIGLDFVSLAVVTPLCLLSAALPFRGRPTATVLGLLLVLRYLPPLIQLAAGEPTFPEYQANATSFLLIAWMDLGVFATTALVAGVSLMLGHGWAKKALYGIVGWLALVAVAVAAMSVTMRIHKDPAGGPGQTIAFLAAAAILTGLAVWLHWPLAALLHESVRDNAGGRQQEGEAES